MSQPFARKVFAAALAVAALAPAGVLAQAAPEGQHVLSRGLSDGAPRQPAALPAHSGDRLVYGRIESLAAETLMLRTRSGRLQRVDASEAIRSGMYSAPLFVGKLVLVGGSYDAARTLHATSVTRQARIDEATGPDR